MKNWLFLIPIILMGCSGSKPTDFVGIYEFQAINNYVVIDTTILQEGLYGKEALNIIKKKLAPLKIDIFKSGEQLAGQMTITILQTYDQQKGLLDRPKDEKMQLSNIHVVNDTLVFDLPKGVALRALKTNSRSFKLVNGSKPSLIVYSDDTASEELLCSDLFEVSGQTIILHSASSLDPGKVSQVNDCLSETAFKKLKGKYGVDHDKYLMEVLHR